MTEFRKSITHSDNDGGVVLETRQDVSDIVQQNRNEFNSYDERARWSDDIFGNKIASIPLTVIDELNKQNIMRGFAVVDQPKFKSWLNNADNRFFRTRPGKI